MQQQFDEILDPLGENAADFFLAASLYHAHKISFARAASLAKLSFEAFLSRETSASLVLLDDLPARKRAQRIGLKSWEQSA